KFPTCRKVRQVGNGRNRSSALTEVHMWMGLRASHPPISPCFPSYLRGAAHLASAQDQWPTASWPAGAHKNIGQGTEILASQALSGGEPDRLRPLETCPTSARFWHLVGRICPRGKRPGKRRRRQGRSPSRSAPGRHEVCSET